MSGGQIIDDQAQIKGPLCKKAPYWKARRKKGMSDRVTELQGDPDTPTASSSAPSLPPKSGKRGSKLWEYFDRDPPLGQASSAVAKSINPLADCKKCDTPKFHPKGSSGLMAHLLTCKGLSKQDLDKAHAIAAAENIVYEGKPEQLDSYVEASKTSAGRKRQRSNSAGSQPSLRSHFDARKPTGEEINRISRALLLFFVMCNVSFESAASPFFLYFLQQLRPLYHPPSELPYDCRLEHPAWTANRSIHDIATSGSHCI